MVFIMVFILRKQTQNRLYNNDSVRYSLIYTIKQVVMGCIEMAKFILKKH